MHQLPADGFATPATYEVNGKQYVANKYKYLFDTFQRNPHLCVKYPDFIELTKDFCDATEVFINTILENKIYLEILNDIGTLQDYFTTLEDDVKFV